MRVHYRPFSPELAQHVMRPCREGLTDSPNGGTVALTRAKVGIDCICAEGWQSGNTTWGRYTARAGTWLQPHSQPLRPRYDASRPPISRMAYSSGETFSYLAGHSSPSRTGHRCRYRSAGPCLCLSKGCRFCIFPVEGSFLQRVLGL